MAVNTTIYNKKFFDNSAKFESPSAKAVVDILVRTFNPKSVVDVGCGSGIYLHEFQNYQIEICGYDGSPAAISGSLVGNMITIHDLTTPLNLDRTFDLALCIEVAEHLESEYADILVDSLYPLANILFFTAATPGQGPESIGHINEQPHSYWIEKFSSKGFVYNQKLSDKIRTQMVEKKVVWWVRKNLMIFQK